MMTVKKKSRYRAFLPLFVVLVAALTVRGVIYFVLEKVQWLPSQNNLMYIEALRYHLGEYLLFTTLKPPLTYLINAATFRLFEPATVFEYKVHLILVFVMDCAAVALLYLASLQLKVNRFLAAALLFIYSIAYIPFELWREGSHYDHHTLLFTSLFIYCLIRVLTNRSILNLILLSLSGGLLVAQSTINVMASFAAILVVVLLSSYNAPQRWLAIRQGVVIGLLGPAFIAGGLIAKNYYFAGVAATSNLAGPAAMMTVQRALGYDSQKVRDLIVKSDAPDWYLQCYDHTIPPLDENGMPYPDWGPLAKAFGICYPWTKPGSEFWPHDFRPLRDELAKFGYMELVTLVDRDVADSHRRQYLFAGFSPELSARWIGQYGQVSLKVYRQLLVENPRAYLGTVAKLHKDFFHGARMVRRIVGSDARRWPELEPIKSWFFVFGILFRWIMVLGYLLLYLGWLVALIEGIRQVNRKYRAKERPIGEPPWLIWFAPFAVLSIPALLMSAAFSSLADFENSRYFMQITPYLVIIASFPLSTLLQHKRALADLIATLFKS